MGFYRVKTKFSDVVPSLSYENNMLGHLKAILMEILSQIFLSLWSAFQFPSGTGRRHHDNQVENENHRPSPSLVPVPVFFIVQSLKNQLPVMQYSCFVERRSAAFVANANDHDPTCIFCINCVETSDEVRELGSCNHVFHKDCIDAWIDHGNDACPLCKSKLLAPAQLQANNSIYGNDPWRRERMIYLFGDDGTF